MGYKKLVMEHGTHCQHKDCHRLNFLPILCWSCNKNFCENHHKYEDHNCPKGKTKYTLPICPKCQNPVPFIDSKRSAEEALKAHICSKAENKKQIQMASTPKSKNKIYTNRCNKEGCKKKQSHPFKCSECMKTFCLQHRFETDHNCIGKQGAIREARLAKFGMLGTLISVKS